MRCTSIHIR